MVKISRVFIILSLVFLSYIVFAQSTFEKLIVNPEDEVISTVVEDSLGNFIMVGRFYTEETHRPLGFIIKLNREGDSVKQKIITQSDSNICFFNNIHSFNGYYYVFGTTGIDTISNKLFYVKLNSELDIVKEEALNTCDNKTIQYMNSILDSDTNFVLTGYTTRIDTNHMGNLIYNYDAFIYKTSLDGDSLNSKFYYEPYPLQLYYDVIEINDSTGYYIFGRDFTDIYSTSSRRYTYSKVLDSISADSVPLGVYGCCSPTYITDDEMLICGQGVPFTPSVVYSLNVLSMDEDASLVNFNHFEINDNIREYPSIQNGVSKNCNNIYIGGTTNLNYASPWFSSSESWYHLVKISPDISPVWEYWYGGDAYYVLYSILATSDGGCIMVGNRFDAQTQYLERDIYVVKVDRNGLMVWEQEITIEENLSTVYPNPGTNLLNIKTPNNTYNFELINFSGNVVASSTISGVSNSINTSNLASGIYFYRLLNVESGKVETGKWIKR